MEILFNACGIGVMKAIVLGLGPLYSGELISASHAWSKGSYGIKVKAKDVCGAMSNWSDPLIIVIEDEPPGV